MANNQLYALLYCTVDGQLLTEEASITVNRSTGSQPVHTVPKGYAGESPGSAMTEVDVTNAVPAAGFEIDAGPRIQGLIQAEIGVLGPGGTTLKAKGFIISDTLRHSVNNEANYDFKWRGPLALFE